MGIGKPTTGGCITAARKPRARNRIFRSENLTIDGRFLLEIYIVNMCFIVLDIFVNSLFLPQIYFLWLCKKEKKKESQ